MLDHQSQLLLAAADGGLLGPLPGHVAQVDHHQAHRLVVEEVGPHGFHHSPAPLPVDEAELGGHLLMWFAQQLFPLGPATVAVVGVDRQQRPAARHAGGTEGQHLLERGAHVDGTATAVEQNVGVVGQRRFDRSVPGLAERETLERRAG